MEHITTTREKDISKTLEAIIIEAKKIEENCLVTSRSHFKAAYVWQRLHFIIGVPTTILAAFSGALAFATFQHQSIYSVILGIFITILTAISTFLAPKDCSSKHLIAGNNYDSLQGKVRIFWTIDCRIEDSIPVLAEKIKNFADQRDSLNKDCDQPPKWAYKMAKKGFAEGETDYLVDKKMN